MFLFFLTIDRVKDLSVLSLADPKHILLLFTRWRVGGALEGVALRTGGCSSYSIYYWAKIASSLFFIFFLMMNLKMWRSKNVLLWFEDGHVSLLFIWTFFLFQLLWSHLFLRNIGRSGWEGWPPKVMCSCTKNDSRYLFFLILFFCLFLF